MNVAVLVCGGTIVGLRGSRSLAIRSRRGAGELVKELCRRIEGVQITVREVLDLLSEDMHPTHWRRIAQEAGMAIRTGANGIMILHGTYTVAYTAAALTYMLRGAPAPIILTGSVLPIEEDAATARMVLSASIMALRKLTKYPGLYFAFTRATGTSREYFADANGRASSKSQDNEAVALIKGTRVRKTHSWRRDCFHSIHEPEIGTIISSRVTLFKDRLRAASWTPTDQFCPAVKLDERVALLKAYPGMSAETIGHIANGNYAGLVIEGYADGTLPTGRDYSLLGSIQEVVKAEIPVFVTSGPIGRATLSAYVGGSKLRRIGATPLGDMTTEAAVVKLMWVLGDSTSVQETKRRMLLNLAGEISGSLTET
ncbi:MAG: asparaginase [candidate division NC10 bacterium]|nr:asparaginase [candidate division NC10 bacterium]